MFHYSHITKEVYDLLPGDGAGLDPTGNPKTAFRKNQKFAKRSNPLKPLISLNLNLTKNKLN